MSTISFKKVYPNPAQNVVNFNMPSGATYTIELLNPLRQVVHSEQVHLSGQEVFTQDFSTLPAGLYLLTSHGSNGSATARLVIEE